MVHLITAPSSAKNLGVVLLGGTLTKTTDAQDICFPGEYVYVKLYLAFEVFKIFKYRYGISKALWQISGVFLEDKELRPFNVKQINAWTSFPQYRAPYDIG